MTININKIFSMSPDSLLSAMNEYDQTTAGNKMILGYDHGHLNIRCMEISQKVFGDDNSSFHLESAIMEALCNQKIYVIDSAHENKIRFIVKYMFGDNKKIDGIQFKMLTEVSVSDLKTAEDVVAILSSFKDGIMYANNDVKPGIISALYNITKDGILSDRVHFDGNTIIKFIKFLGCIVVCSDVVNRKNIIQGISKITLPVEVVDWQLYDNNIMKELLRTLSIAVQHVDMEDQLNLITIIDKIIKKVNFSKRPFDDNDVVKELLSVLSMTLKNSASENVQSLLQTLYTVTTDVNSIMTSLDDCYLVGELFNVFGMAIERANANVFKNITERINEIKSLSNDSYVAVEFLEVMCLAVQKVDKHSLLGFPQTILSIAGKFDFSVEPYNAIDVTKLLLLSLILLIKKSEGVFQERLMQEFKKIEAVVQGEEGLSPDVLLGCCDIKVSTLQMSSKNIVKKKQNIMVRQENKENKIQQMGSQLQQLKALTLSEFELGVE